jgi:hypothetical protein
MRLQGAISIKGCSLVPTNSVEAHVVGHSISGPLAAKWQMLSVDRPTGAFHAELATAAGGFCEADVRVRHGAGRADTLAVPHVGVAVPHVGVGEVFVVSGQSNSTNYGEVPQVTETGMVRISRKYSQPTLSTSFPLAPAGDSQPETGLSIMSSATGR